MVSVSCWQHQVVGDVAHLRPAPSWKAATFCMPLVGNQPSVMENSTISISPAQNTGVA